MVDNCHIDSGFVCGAESSFEPLHTSNDVASYYDFNSQRVVETQNRHPRSVHVMDSVSEPTSSEQRVTNHDNELMMDCCSFEPPIQHHIDPQDGGQTVDYCDFNGGIFIEERAEPLAEERFEGRLSHDNTLMMGSCSFDRQVQHHNNDQNVSDETGSRESVPLGEKEGPDEVSYRFSSKNFFTRK